MRPEILVCFAVEQEAGPFRRLVAGMSDLTILVSGMGRNNAEKAVRAALGAKRFGLVLTSGFAGGLKPDLKLGDVLFSAHGLPRISAALMAAGAIPGRFCCSSRVAAFSAEKFQLRNQTGADAVEMESEFIDGVCREQRIPCATLRVILDTAKEDLPLDFNALMTPTQQLDGRKLAWSIAKSPAKIIGLIRLHKRSQIASRRLACILESAINNV